MRRFRFGFQVRAGSAVELVAQAQAAEAAGFDVVHTFDHVGDHWTPLLPLLAMAQATTTLRVCPLVLNNDFHHPVHLAAEISSLDHLTGGRVEVGIGAGHSFTEYAAIGQRFDPPAVRKARMAEAVEIIRQLLDGAEVTHRSEHYQLTGARVMQSHQQRVPIMVGVNGKAALAHAAVHADCIGLTMLGRTLADGQRHEVRWQAARLDDTIACIADHAAKRSTPLELNALVQVVEITDDRQDVATRLVGELGGLSVEDVLATPFVAIGTHDEIAEHLLRCRERWGISYFSVRSNTEFAPVIARLRAADASLS